MLLLGLPATEVLEILEPCKMLLLLLRCILVSETDPLSRCLVLQASVKEDGTLWVLVEQGILGFHGTRWGQWASGILLD